MDKLLSTAKVGQALGVSTGWARRLATTGHFGPIVKTGTDSQRGRIYAYNSGVEAYLAERVRQRVRVEVAHTQNEVVNELLRRRQERGRQPKAS